MKRKQDTCGVLRKDTSLKFLISNCQDFEEEKTFLQTMGWSMGVLIDLMPKCHCELAGEGELNTHWDVVNMYFTEPSSH